MKRATPDEMKKCIEAVEIFKNMGILFVPMPVFTEADQILLVKASQKRLNEIFQKQSDIK